MRKIFIVCLFILISSLVGCAVPTDHDDSSDLGIELTYAIVDTGVIHFYNNDSIIAQPTLSDAFYGQDAMYHLNEPNYTDHGDGTVTDNVTGLMWQQDMGVKVTYQEAMSHAENLVFAGYDDWRVPTIKELYSLIIFTGNCGGEVAGTEQFIDTDYFYQPFGDSSIGEREIDAQTWSSTMYTGETMNGDLTVFGVNFIDGRIKGYPYYKKGVENLAYFRFVRGNEEYGKNNLIDNNDGTITDLATGLMWQQADSGVGMEWEDSLYYANALDVAGYDDRKLPNAKELQSIVDYSRSPFATQSAAINPLFSVSTIIDTNEQLNYPYYWTSMTHLTGKGANLYTSAVYVAFGDGQGIMNSILMDVHGAGCQRSDPKSGNVEDYPASLGPQGDIQRVFNYVRCVRTVTIFDETNK